MEIGQLCPARNYQELSCLVRNLSTQKKARGFAPAFLMILKLFLAFPFSKLTLILEND